MNRIRHAILAAAAALTFAVAAGCGGADIGEECDTPSSTDECVDNAVCTNEAGGVNRCRQLCREQADCPMGTTCNGISGGSLKSCQPD